MKSLDSRAFSCPRLRDGLIDLLFYSFESKEATTSKSSAFAAKLFLSAVSVQRPIPLCMLESCGQFVAYWFNFQLRRCDLPVWFRTADPSSLQACIASPEALAQLILMVLISEKSALGLSCFSF